MSERWRSGLARGAALFVVLATAKVLVCVLRSMDGAPIGLWRIVTACREEAIVTLAFTLVAAALPRFIRVAYFALAAIAALSIPVTRVFASPLTASMREATGGAIADSIRENVSPSNVLAILFVAVLAIVIERNARFVRSVHALAIATAILGYAAPPPTLALHRDPVVALVSTEIARRLPSSKEATESGEAVAAEDDPETRGLDLRYLAGAARGRHVIWIVLESTGARYLAPYGNKVDPMPTLTRLASEGIVFDHAYAVYPESIKGLYAMLCSFAPAPHTPARTYAANALPCRSIAETLKGEGYATALFHSGRFAYLGMDHVVRDRGYDVLADAKTIGGKHASSFGTDDMSTVKTVLARFDERRADERLFITYMPISGHHPYESPGEGPRPFGERTDFERYESDLYRGDLALAELVSGLRARGLWNDTLFVIHGDHGEAFQQHEGNFAHTLFAYDENIHVPLVVVAPGLVRGGMRARQLVSLLDVAPTIAELVGAAPDARWQGISALHPEQRVVRSFADHTSVKLALRTGRHKLVFDADTERTELFDLVADPGEQRPIDDRSRSSAYRADLERWAASQRALASR